ncbi:Transposase [Sedimentisphaera cyanobacteriorum]|uniref:Transposase n=1 Tax=Sedimentisphaera cyanobacteriorum TaxID=1940790 RepID=A0A1Q2HSK8_9BACT|nr:IS1634 family transposase [Sedimentisphaera cyanobacteriorum]AQQ10246.1 Transposase [Sedimentisphaera cyanobacteriorum]AQQ10368.1 Transposase [Sedimentisphaera cyanobacteriorum]
MYLKKHKRKKNGKINSYYSIAEKRKVSRGRYVEKMVLYLGEISDSQKKSWQRSIEIINEDNKPVRKSLFAFDQDNHTHHDIDTIPVKLSKMKLNNPRTFGDCWLGCEIWDMLGLDTFWSERIDTAKSPVDYSKVVKLLTVNRLIKPGAEFYVHRHWFTQTAMDVLLGCEFDVAEKNRLYRCLDRILPYKEELCSYLKDTWQMMFNLEYDILLYDITSTYFEGLCKSNPKAKFGHSKDRRGDCRQILIALVVTPEGFPINYEILAGNTSERTTLKPLLNKIESKYGKAGRLWLMDRGIPTEAVLEYMRDNGIDYLVGTPRKLLDEFQEELSVKSWFDVNGSVRIKHIAKDDECYILARSKERMAKERAMRKRKLRNYLEGLEKLKKCRSRDVFMQRLGKLKHQAGSCRKCVTLTIPRNKERIEKGEFDYKFEASKYKEMIYRDGTYFLRTNQSGKDGAALWKEYMLQCNVEQAFRELKSDLGIRPVYHHKQDRVEAHVFVAFMSYCLQVTLRHKLRASACGMTAQAALAAMSRIQMLDVSFETQDSRTLLMQRYTEPEDEHKLLLQKLKIELPPQKPPKIYSGKLKK